ALFVLTTAASSVEILWSSFSSRVASVCSNSWRWHTLFPYPRDVIKDLIASPSVKKPMNHRRGNPNWGRPLPPVPASPTEFENMVRRLKLMPEMYATSHELRRWCHLNRNRCYVPEWLLQEWRMNVEIGYGNDAA